MSVDFFLEFLLILKEVCQRISIFPALPNDNSGLMKVLMKVNKGLMKVTVLKFF